MLELCGQVCVIGEGTVLIPPEEFMDDKDIDGVMIPNTVTGIGRRAFARCRQLIGAEIPESVITIGPSAFEECGLTEITIPDSAKEIGRWAFAGCRDLSAAALGSSVEKIGREAFIGCGLAGLNIPASAAQIGAGAFAFCPGLTHISVSPGNRRYKSVRGVLFSKSGKKLVCCPAGRGRTQRRERRVSYKIPDWTAEIGDEAFAGCEYLGGVRIPDSVVKIGKEAFCGCGFSRAAIPDSVTKIGPCAFGWCPSLARIEVGPGNGYYSSEGGVLFGGDGTVLICCPAGKRGTYTAPAHTAEIGKLAFCGCSRLTRVTFPAPVAVIRRSAFSRCRGIACVTIENPDCVIENASDTLPRSALIRGFAGSSAERFAKAGGMRFSALRAAGRS